MSAPLITLDRVLAVDAGASASAIRNVPNTLAVLDSHFPRFPVLPGVLILGSIGELAALLLTETAGGAWRMSGADTVRYRHFVQPGDQLRIVVELASHDDGAAVCKGTVTVDDKPVTTVRRLHLERLT